MSINNEETFTMATRLKQLREDHGYSHDRLSAAIYDKYGVKISSDSLMNYEVSDPYHSKAGKNQGMRVEYIRILSDFYNVSTDYLLGLSEVSSKNLTIQAAVTELGLSEEIISRLVAWNKPLSELEACESIQQSYINDVKEDLNFTKHPESFKKHVIEFSNTILSSYLTNPRIITRWYQNYMHSLYVWYLSSLRITDHDRYVQADEIDLNLEKYGLVTFTAEDAATIRLRNIWDLLSDEIERLSRNHIFKIIENTPHIDADGHQE